MNKYYLKSSDLIDEIFLPICVNFTSHHILLQLKFTVDLIFFIKNIITSDCISLSSPENNLSCHCEIDLDKLFVTSFKSYTLKLLLDSSLS